MLNIVDNDEVLISGKKHYMKIHCIRELAELHTDVVSDTRLTSLFYINLKNNIDNLSKITEHIKMLSAQERVIILSKLLPLPIFLSGEYGFYLEVNESDFKTIKSISDFLNTNTTNLSRIIYYVSIPNNMYGEFPFMVEQYKFIEEIINYYIEKTGFEQNSHGHEKVQFQYYDSILNHYNRIDQLST